MVHEKHPADLRDQEGTWVMNPSRITVAVKLRWRTMKYGSEATQGRLVHQIQGLPRSAIRTRAHLASPVVDPKVRVLGVVEDRPRDKRPRPPREPYGAWPSRCE